MIFNKTSTEHRTDSCSVILKVLLFVVNTILLLAYIKLRHNTYICVFISLFSIVLLILFILTHTIKKLYHLKPICIPWGAIIIAFCVTENISLCSSIIRIVLLTIVFAILPLSVMLSFYREKILHKCLVLLCAFLIILGQLLFVNQYLDYSEPKFITGNIVEKYANGTWFGTYPFSFFEVNTEEYGLINISAKGKIYASYSVGDNISVGVREGFLDIKYCFITEAEPSPVLCYLESLGFPV